MGKYMNQGQALRVLRHAYGYTLDEAARLAKMKIGTSATRLQQVEVGGLKVNKEDLARLAELYKVSTGFLSELPFSSAPKISHIDAMIQVVREIEKQRKKSGR